MYSLVIFLYSTVIRLISPFHRKARLMVKGHREVFKKLQRELNPAYKYIWLHAASLGEFEQARPIIENIKSNYPDYKILLTFFSSSGYEVQKNYPLADIVCYLPFDTKRNVKRFLKLTNPHLVIFIKYEFWYNYINGLHKLNIPTYMVSAIFRSKQFFFRWYGRPLQKMLTYYRCICVQDENSKLLLSKIDIHNVEVCGDTRFDRVLEIRKQAKSIDVVEKFIQKKDNQKGLTLVAGSSWPKDEDIFIEFFNNNLDIKLIIAPHEIDEAHLNYIETVVRRKCIRISKYSQNIDISEYDCMIIDSFGLLSSLYRYADIAYVGGGFGVGIHNVIEAAVYNIPVIFGPNFKKFREARQLIEVGGGYSIHNEESFFGLMNEFIAYPEILKSAGSRAGEYVKNNSGVVDKVMGIIRKNIY